MLRGSLARLRRFLEGLRGLFTFLTIIPMGGSFEEAQGLLYLAPFIGLVEGIFASIPMIAAGAVSAALATALVYIVNGFQHIDGFLDFGEALLSGRRGGDALRIMKDPHKGAFAITLAVINIILTYTAILSLSRLTLAALPIALSSSALSMFTTANRGRPADSGMGKLFVEKSKGIFKLAYSIIVYVISSAIILTICGWLSLSGFLVIAMGLLAAAASSSYVVHISHVRLGFVNGDVLGFSYELNKIVVLLLYAYTLPHLTSLP